MLLIGIGILFSFGINTTAATNSSTIYVNNQGNNSWNGLNSTWTAGTLNGPKLTIQNATGTVKSGGTVYIANGTYFENNILIKTNMTIIGQSQQNTIIFGGKAGIFTIGSGVDLTICNLTLTNGNSFTNGGGAIYNNGNLTVKGITFSNNYANADNGGAIYNNHGSTLTVTNCAFFSNTALNNGGAIYNNGTLTVTSSGFSGGNAMNGGAIYNDVSSVLNINNSSFSNNNASQYGGAIYNTGSTVMDNDFLINNIATSEYSDGSNGGAITNNGTLSVNSSNFNNNTAYNDGGAIYSYSDAILKVNDSSFTNNLANNGYGGAIGNDGTCTLNDSTFISNNAGPGGAVANMGYMNATQCTFINNNATTFGGALLNIGTLNLSTSTFTNNTAVKCYGGAIVNAGQLTINGSNSYTDNSAYVGGVIYNAGNLIINAGSVYKDNQATVGGVLDNGLFNVNNQNLIGNATITNNTFIDNSAGNGGVISNDGTLIVKGGTFEDNTAPNGGGAISNDGNMTISTSTFTGNTAANGDGGAIDSEPGVQVALPGNPQQSGSAPAKSASPPAKSSPAPAPTPTPAPASTTAPLTAIVPVSSTATDVKADMTQAKAAQIPITNIIGCIFVNNIGFEGGAIYNNEGYNLTVTTSTFENNNATNFGGAIDNDGNLIASYNNFTANEAIWGGGAISNGEEPRAVAVAKTRLVSLNVDLMSAAPADNEPNMTVTSNNFIGNMAIDSNGGAMISDGYATINFNRIINNYAVQYGAIDNYGNTINATLNWWGTNAGPLNDVSGNITVTPWIVLNITANPSTIKDNTNSQITSELRYDSNGVYHDPVNGHVPDGIPVVIYPTTLAVGFASPTSGMLNNAQMQSVFTAEHSGTAIIMTTVDNQTVSTPITITPVANLYMNITSSKYSTKVGEVFTITYKLGNNGPDSASNVTVSIPLPNGFELSNITGNGNWTYNATNSTITWTLMNVPVGDPYLYITGNTANTGAYMFGSSISADTYLNVDPVSSITIKTTKVTKTTITAEPANASQIVDKNTIPMQHTGVPVTGLVVGVLSLIGGLVKTRKR